MKARSMDAQSLTVDLIPRLFGVSPATVDHLLGRDGVHQSIAPEMERIFRATLSGEHLNRLILAALTCFGETLNSIGHEPVEIPNLYLWLRQAMSKATSEALWGKENNPYGKDTSVIDAQWYGGS